MNDKSLTDLAKISAASYYAPNIEDLPSGTIPSGYVLVGERTSIPVGFNGASFYNAYSNTLVIGIGGTNFANPLDILQNYGVAGGGTTGQYFEGIALTREAMTALGKQGVTDPKVVFTGHSLGGVSAQMLSQLDPNSKAVVFNSPGVMGIWGNMFGMPGSANSNSKYNSNVTYVYSEHWGIFTPIHAIGARIPDSTMITVPNTSGHKIQPLIDSLSAAERERLEKAGELGDTGDGPERAYNMNRANSSASSTSQYGEGALCWKSRTKWALKHSEKIMQLGCEK